MIPDEADDQFGTEVPPDDPFVTDVSNVEQLSPTLGAYRILQPLGRGGMGVVYEAEPILGGPHVALKTLQSGSAASLARLKAEFRIVADLAHPNLVQLGELVTTEREPFFTMEIVRGVAFDDFVRMTYESVVTGPPIPYNERRLRESLIQLADGLNALHSVGLIHRDIKPTNVLVTHEGRVVILDMGLAVETDDNQFRNQQRELAGTPYYMAPEQARGETLTSACDWYAVGVILFETLTGERAFQSRKADSLLQEKMQLNRPVPRDIHSAVPEVLNQLCCDLLHPDPLSRPTGADVVRRLQGSGATAINAPIWIGRERELARLEQAWTDTNQGLPQVVFIAGTSGLGKTSLVEHFLTELRHDVSIVVLRGRCYDNESVAYRGFDGVVDSLAIYLRGLPRAEVERVLPLDLDQLCQLFPVLGEVPSIAAMRGRQTHRPGDARERRQKGIAALRELLCRLARFVPVVVFVDDLQLGDDDTAAVFSELYKQTDAPAALFIATFRSEDAESNRCLRQIRRSQLSPADANRFTEQIEIAIDKLSEPESIRLASSLLLRASIHDMDEVNRIVAEAEGDPLFIRMLADYRSRKRETASDRESKGAPKTKTKRWTLATVIKDKVQSLEPLERIAIEMLSAAGRPVDAQGLEMAVGTEGRSIALIRSLRIKRLVRRLSDRERVEIFHDKIRETVLAMLEPAQTAAHCLAVAAQIELAKTERDVDFLADLYRRGGERQRAGECYEIAAVKSEQTYAFNRAIECYRFAIELLHPHGDHERRLRRGLADSLANASRSAEAADQYLKAAAVADSGEAAQLTQLASLRYLTSGHVEQGIIALRKALAACSITWPSNRLIAVAGLLSRTAFLRLRGFKMSANATPTVTDIQKIDACWAAAAGLSLVDPLRGSYYIAETLRRSLRSGSTRTIARDLAAYMGVAAIGGSRSRPATARVLRACRAITLTHHDHYSRAMQQMTQGMAALLRGHWNASLRSCDRAIEYLSDASCYGKTWELNTARTFALWSLQYQGKLVELSRRQPELLRWAKESDDLFATLNFGTQVTAHLQLADDNPQESLRRLAEDKQRLSDRGFFIQHHNYVLAQTYTLIYLGDEAAALQSIVGQWKHYRREFLSQIQQVRIDHRQVLARAWLTSAANHASGKSEKLSEAKRLIRSLRREQVEWASALADALEASWYRVAGHHKQARVMLEAAQCSLEKAGMQLFTMAAMHHHATCKETHHSEETACALEKQWRELGIVAGDRFANMLIPGFTR